MEKVIAVVVSYNREALLRECIDALRNQTRKPDAILVVNNGSTDNTLNWLKQQPDLLYITQENLGGAGGFNTGIAWAYQHGYAWIWCMDDDGYPQCNALEELLKHEPQHRALLNCAVISKEDRQSFVWKTGHYKKLQEVTEPLIKGIAHPFNGTLIHRAIVERVGTPKTDLFLWGDETEYYYRIVKQNEFPVYTVSTSVHYHPPSAFSYKNDWDFKSAWKMYYYIRNRFHVHRAKCSGGLSAIMHYAAFIVAFCGIILVYQKTDRLRKLSFIVWPVKDALQHNFSATPPLILRKLNQQASVSLFTVWQNNLKQLWQAALAPFNPAAKAKAANA
jgi:rhamnopyranosyl-N-acetylglucosaminyl-diphospho-decaprenol beta-1,3/1,4-galactofuranosyltransferase